MKPEVVDVNAIRSFAVYTIAVLVLTPLLGLSRARADDADLAQVLKTLKALEARVATLESEKQQYRREAASARAETQALRQKLGRQPNPNPPAAAPLQLPPSGSYAMATKAPLVAAVPTWGGFYAGASFGLAVQGAHKDEVNPSASTETDVEGASTNTFTSSDVFTSSLGGRDPGAMANLFLGYNYMLPSDFFVGGQIEGGISNMRTRLTGPFSDPSQSLATFNNAGTTQISTNLNAGNTTGHLDDRWVMSALARGGLVVDPKDLVYLIGGLSYGRFEFNDQSFGAFGGTVGAGWERKITPSWTFKAEYRYTRFQDHTETVNFASSNSGTTKFNIAAIENSVSSSASVDTNRFSGLDWHTVMIGVSHYFDAN
jgi:opacity protein-like surface antigen